MTMLNTSSSWNVGRAGAKCAACSTELAPNVDCWAALCDGGQVPVREAAVAQPTKSAAKKGEKEEPAPSPFVRVDFCEACWAAGKRPDHLAPAEGGAPLTMFSFWKTVVPVPQQKK